MMMTGFRALIGLSLLLFANSAASDVWSSLYRDKLKEANNGNGEAQFDVGTMYQNGRGVRTDREKAIEWYKKAAAQGEPKAVSRLQLMKSNSERFEKTAAQAENGDQESLYDLGNMYMKGVGTNTDYAKAIDSYTKSAGLGHVKSAYKLGLIFHEGSGVKTDNRQAFRWFKQAAQGGYPAAQYYLGKLYAAGQGVKRDRTEALVWFGKAVDGGFDQARGEMINISENIDAVAITTPEPAPEAARTKAPPVQKKSAGKKVARRKSARKPAKVYSLEDVALAAWNRDGEPVTFLPSTINTCRSEGSKLVCFSDDQVRNAGANVVKYKTKTIIKDFSADGSFTVTYRNLVTNSTQLATEKAAADSDEIGSVDTSLNSAHKVKIGWSTPHTLQCKIKDSGTVSCLKNNTHAMILTSPTTLASGN